jgi:hypothetical protein
MRRPTKYSTAFILALLLLGTRAAQAQEGANVAAARLEAEQREQINHEVQLHLLLASDAPNERNNVPQSLDEAIRQLKTTLPFQHYRLVSTFFDRVRDGGTVEVSGVGGFPLAPAASSSTTPTFFTLHLSNVVLLSSRQQPFIQVGRFRFGLKVPIQTGSARAEGSVASVPVIQYQDTGLVTELSVREGMPTIIGTLAASQPNEVYVLVLTLKRTTGR